MVRVIAEVGSNWATKDDIIKSVETAANLGAWAVKFQRFNEREMYGWGSDTYNFPERYLGPVKYLCDKNGIKLGVTAFSAKGVRDVNDYVDFHKVASSDVGDQSLLEAIADTGKQTLLSTGKPTT
jgi:sialic acid synthase SpsE